MENQRILCVWEESLVVFGLGFAFAAVLVKMTNDIGMRKAVRFS
jgi:hypothetical protein